MNKVIFLDVDGVLNRDSTKSRDPAGFTGVDDELLGNLHELVSKSGAHVILTSTWKKDYTEKTPSGMYLDNKLRQYGIEIADVTHDDQGKMSRRGSGINRYLNQNHVDRWIVIDDDIFMDYGNEIFNHLVLTNNKTGLSKGHVMVALEMLE